MIRDSARRWPYVAATASAFAFAVGAGIDWAWELSVLPIAFMVLAAGVLAPRRYRSPSRIEGFVLRGGLIALGIVAMVAYAVHYHALLGAEAVNDSQSAARSGDLPAALHDAEHAQDLQPYASTPDLQRALVLEQMGRYAAAVGPARDATEAASKDWRTWLVLSRLQAEAGRPGPSIAAYERAKSLNPRSIVFTASQAAG